MDSGATNHVFPQQASRYTDAHVPKCITIANDVTTHVYGCRDLAVILSLLLRSVLHVPASAFNLLSVSHLTQEHDCSVTFTLSSFVVQDQQMWRVIGTGRLSNELYTLDIPASVLSSVTFVDWHHRLGHAPLPILRKALPDFPFTEFQCETCIHDK
ncbi:hypothetical protein KSP39_PZI001311 [Platanthera zijinensis]|uniref:Retrovirus-related Pol polyprotein from transposon TNT 1-94-like beta-barrel domain-containing protein n=1 Tax=Platanthera zijinensis TaxID=2320716 RepID=A0AAP0C1K8_9ASPA